MKKYNLLTGFTGKLRFVPSASEITFICKSFTHWSWERLNREIFAYYSPAKISKVSNNIKVTHVINRLPRTRSFGSSRKPPQRSWEVFLEATWSTFVVDFISSVGLVYATCIMLDDKHCWNGLQRCKSQ